MRISGWRSDVCSSDLLWPDDPAMVLVQGLIEIARQLNVHVVAEGIETEVQASQLWTMGCVLGQGFEFSRAVDRAAMTELLRRHAEGVEGAIPLASNIQPAHSQLSPTSEERRVGKEGVS